MRSRRLTFYVCTDDLLVALNAKAASSTLAYEIFFTHHPLQAQVIREKIIAAGHDPTKPVWHSFCPTTTDYAGKTVVVPVREPIDRFCAAAVQTKRDSHIDRILDELEEPPAPPGMAYPTSSWWQHAQADIHFLPQVRFQQLPDAAAVQHFVVPDQLQQLAYAAALPWPMTEMNRSAALPVLTDTQIERLTHIYAADIAFYNSVAAQGS